MERALVIRSYGNQKLASAFIPALESSELRKLRAEIGVRQNRDNRYYMKRIVAARRKYGRNKPMKKIWGIIGLAVLLFENSNPSRKCKR